MFINRIRVILYNLGSVAYTAIESAVAIQFAEESSLLKTLCETYVCYVPYVVNFLSPHRNIAT